MASFSPSMWTTAKREGKKNNLKRMWDKLMQQVDLEEPPPLLDQENLGCTQRECKPNLKIVQGNEDMLESLVSAGTIKQLPRWERSHADTVAWSYDMEEHAKKCVEKGTAN